MDDREIMEAQLSLWEGRVAQAWRTLLEELSAVQEGDEVAKGLFDDVMARVQRLAGSFGDRLNEAYVDTAQAIARFLEEALRSSVTFDGTNRFAVDALARARLQAVQQLTSQQQDAIYLALQGAVERGENPAVAARAIRSAIGLNARQVAAVAEYERLLRANSRDALRRLLRDRRSDAALDRAVRSGEPLGDEQIGRMVARYADRQRAYRATVVARTEALSAVSAGQDEMYRQALAAGRVRPKELSLRWWTARDERVRGSHRPMHGQERTWAQLDAGELFESGAGNLLRRPGDPNAPASETVQCRCVRSVRVRV